MIRLEIKIARNSNPTNHANTMKYRIKMKVRLKEQKKSLFWYSFIIIIIISLPLF